MSILLRFKLWDLSRFTSSNGPHGHFSCSRASLPYNSLLSFHSLYSHGESTTLAWYKCFSNDLPCPWLTYLYGSFAVTHRHSAPSMRAIELIDQTGPQSSTGPQIFRAQYTSISSSSWGPLSSQVSPCTCTWIQHSAQKFDRWCWTVVDLAPVPCCSRSWSTRRVSDAPPSPPRSIAATRSVPRVAPAGRWADDS